MRRRVMACTLVLVFGCGDAKPEPAPIPEPDYDVFVADVQPVLIRQCSNPSGCHGTTKRPFALYAPKAHRKRPEETFSSEPLTPEEMRFNYDRTRSFAVDDGTGPELLTRPLAEDAGGIAHSHGGDIYSSTSDRHYRLLRDWLEEKDR